MSGTSCSRKYGYKFEMQKQDKPSGGLGCLLAVILGAALVALAPVVTALAR